ncbi:hypothetical protein D5S18_13250 [Nocardia panacis]|uniref:DUF4397 domain-containing protein n=2 Tax=Nocardia panacis TaxID=2340916 RepID=A0A3A4L4P6_9NOCA|nr:hypothetical protein D5S18_13250 [Nocardia panacis]
MLALVKPKIRINGHPVPVTRWGSTHIPVGPGVYDIWVATPWIFDMGAAGTRVMLQPGQAARIYYRSPALIFLNGAIGPEPQKTPGAVFMYIMWAVILLLVVLPMLLTVFI